MRYFWFDAPSSEAQENFFCSSLLKHSTIVSKWYSSKTMRPCDTTKFNDFGYVCERTFTFFGILIVKWDGINAESLDLRKTLHDDIPSNCTEPP